LIGDKSTHEDNGSPNMQKTFPPPLKVSTNFDGHIPVETKEDPPKGKEVSATPPASSAPVEI
ncbi:hypothetical protein HAX54_017389, partial [Datura stramonium]|nr:hypothetical protein [Datura stramonium]